MPIAPQNSLYYDHVLFPRVDSKTVDCDKIQHCDKITICKSPGDRLHGRFIPTAHTHKLLTQNCSVVFLLQSYIELIPASQAHAQGSEDTGK